MEKSKRIQAKLNWMHEGFRHTAVCGHVTAALHPVGCFGVRHTNAPFGFAPKNLMAPPTFPTQPGNEAPNPCFQSSNDSVMYFIHMWETVSSQRAFTTHKLHLWLMQFWLRWQSCGPTTSCISSSFNGLSGESEVGSWFFIGRTTPTYFQWSVAEAGSVVGSSKASSVSKMTVTDAVNFVYLANSQTRLRPFAK